VFQIRSVAVDPEWHFPSKKVSGFTRQPTIRLITCGGRFDPRAHG
jgi:hypothetical protein